MTKLHFPLILLIINTSVFASNDINLNTYAGLILDDNITRADLSRDVVDDTILNLGLSADYKLPINDISKLLIDLSLDINQYQDISNWSFYDLALQFDYQIQPDSGYTALWYFLSFTYGQLSYDRKQRDGSYNNIGLGMVKRLSDTIDLRFAIESKSIDADEATGVFDLDSTRIYLNFDYKFDANNIGYITLAHNDGDFVSTVRWDSNIVSSLVWLPMVNDDIFSPGSWDSYKMDATTLSLLLGYNYAIDSNQSMDASIMYYSTDAYASIDYTGIIMQFSYMYRF